MNLSMSDLISRAELKKTAKRIASMPWCDEDGNRVEFEWSSKELERLIDKAPSAEPLTEEDYTELRDRFGEFVEFVVRDMISGKGERWK